MATAVLVRRSAHFDWIREHVAIGRHEGVLTVTGVLIVMPRRGHLVMCGSRAEHRAHRPAHGKDREEGQQGGADGPLPDRAHDTSIRRRAARHSVTRRRRNALPITDTELKLIAAAAIIGLSSNPTNG
jgi:hypothetical protein